MTQSPFAKVVILQFLCVYVVYKCLSKATRMQPVHQRGLVVNGQCVPLLVLQQRSQPKCDKCLLRTYDFEKAEQSDLFQSKSSQILYTFTNILC